MYLPKYFRLEDHSAMRELISAYPLASVVHTHEGVSDANHFPLRWRDGGAQGLLVGHVARGNPLWRQADGQQVLTIFNGPQAYVSPQWYPSKAVDGRAVPTWNYAVVHARGRLRAIEDSQWLRQFLAELTEEHEAFQERPWTIDEAPDDYIARQLRGIVGIEIELETLVGKFKLHQNHPKDNQRGVIDGLDGRDQSAADVATAMRRLRES